MKRLLRNLALMALLCIPWVTQGQQSLPYSYGFEDNDLSADGWTTQNPSGLDDSKFIISTDAAKTGDYGFQFSSYDDQGDHTQYLISPELDATTGVVFKFYYRAYESYGVEIFKVGYSTTNTDISSFTFGSEISTNNTSWAQSEEFIFPAGTKYVAIFYYADWQYYLYVDDFSFTVPPSCSKPGVITPGTIGATSATISWMAGGSETSWNVYLTQSGSPVAGYNPLVVNTNPTCTFSGLTANTTYDVAVEAICGGDVSDQRTSSFSTDFCEVANQCAITIVLNDSYGDGWNGNKLQVVDDATSIVLGEYTITSGSSANYTLNVCSDRDINFVYVASGSYQYENGWSITDVNDNVITEHTGGDSSDPATAGTITTYTPSCAPITCPKPTGLTVDNASITAHGAELSWTENGTATQWQICLDGDEVNLLLVNTNPYTLTGLTQDHAYTAKVRAYCDASDQSNWSNVVNFTTLETCAKPTATAVSNITATSATISWTGSTSSYKVRYRRIEGFEKGLGDWTTIDADGDGYDWIPGSLIGGVYLVDNGSLYGTGHNSSDGLVCSGSYSNVTGNPLTPDNWLVSPEVTLGGEISFWANSQDASYPSEQFGVFVSTAVKDNPSAFAKAEAWTLNADGTGTPDPIAKVQGTWGKFTVDLSAYSGQGYVAIRHYGCSDMFILNIDDVVISEPGSSTWTEISTTETTLNLTGLEGYAAYEVQVQKM